MSIEKNLIYFVIYAFISNSIFAASNCNEVDKKVNIRASLSERGLEKVVALGLDQAKKPIEDGLKNLEIKDFRKYSDSKVCKKFQVDKMTTSEAWTKCPGMPLALISDAGVSFSDIGKPLPSHYQFKNINIAELKIGDISIHCAELVCDIAIPINKLAVTSDINVDNAYNGKSIFGAKEATLIIKKNKNNEAPVIKFKAQLSPDGELEDLIQLPNGFLSANLPVNSLKIGVGGKSQEQELENTMKQVFDKDLKKELADIKKRGAVKFLPKELGSKKYRKWFSKEFEKFSDRYVDLFQKRHAKNNEKYFLNKKSYELYMLAQVFTEHKGGLVQQIMGAIVPKIAKAVEKNVEKAITPFTTKIPFIHDEYNVANTSLRVQDHINHSKYKKGPRKFLAQLNKCIDKQRSKYCDFEPFEELLVNMRKSSNEKDIEILSQMKLIAKRGLESLRRVKNKGMLAKRARKKGTKSLNKMRSNLYPRTLKSITDNIYQRDLKQQIQIAVKSIEETSGILNMYLTACIGCGEVKFPELAEEPLKVDISPDDYDVAIGIDLKTINAAMEILQKKGMLDFCVSGNEFISCKEADFFDQQERIEFKKAPKLVWSEKKQAYILKISDLLREQDILGLPTSWIGNRDYNDLDIAMRPGISPDGKSVHLTPVGDINLDYGIVRDGQSLLIPALLTIVAPYAGVVFEVARAGAHELVADYATESIRSNMNKSVDVTDKLPLERIVKIQSDENEIRVYSILK